MKRLLLLALAFSAGPATAAAQTCSTPNGAAAGTCSVNIASSLTIPTLLRLTIDDTSTALATPTEADYDAPAPTVASMGPVATIKTNGNWTLLVRATAATWTGTGGARTTKPAGDLLWGLTSGAAGTPMTTTDATVATGTRGANNTISLFYKTVWTWSLDTPGTYSLTVVFTATSP